MTSHEKYLKQLTISSDIPGTILKDFETLLSCIEGEEIAVTKSKKLLPMPWVQKINEALCRPYETGLKRPLHNAFPNAAALYLLLRASGIALISKKGAKEIITIDPEMLVQWRSLNPTEQFFSLLEIWLIKAEYKIIDESPLYHYDPFHNSIAFYSKLTGDPMKIEGDPRKEDRIRYLPGPVALALMDFFGMIRINAMPVKTGKRRQVDTIVPTLFGDAIWSVLDAFNEDFHHAQFLQLAEIGEQETEDSEEALEEWRSFIRSEFPEWKNTLTLPIPPFEEGIHIFKLLFYKGWCRIAIPGNASLDELAQIILRSINFDNDHLYQFQYQGRTGREYNIDHPYLEAENPTTDEMQVGSLPIPEGTEMTFIFDFGDYWEFGLVLEKRNPEGMTIDKPAVIESRGEPPEQYGW